MSDPGFGRSMARGASAIVGVAFVTKLMAMLGQFVIAAYLSESEYGLWGMALAMADAVGMVQFLGVRDILTNRQKRVNEWMNAAFWITACAGLVTVLLAAVLAPLSPGLFNADASLGPMIMLATVAVVVSAFSEIFQGKLLLEFRFGVIAKVSVVEGLVRVIGQVAAAALGFGALGLIFVRLVTWTSQTVVCGILARPALKMTPDLALWREASRDISNIFVTRVAELVMRRGDVLMLGFFASEAVVGVYYFAYGLSLQITVLICQSLTGVLSAGLSKLQDDLPRLRKAFFSAMRMLSFIGVPLLVIQAATCGPGLRMLYLEKWEEAILPLQILSISACFSLAGWNTTAVFTARGLFRRQKYVRIISGLCYLLTMTIAATWQSALVVSVAQLIFVALYVPLQITVATGGGWLAVRESMLTVFRPFAVVASGAALALWLTDAIDPAVVRLAAHAGEHAARASELVRLVVVASLTGLWYWVGARLLLKRTYAEFAQRVRQILPDRLSDRVPGWLL